MTNWADFEGRCLISGIKIDEISGGEMVNVCYSLIITDIMNSEISRVEARTEFEKRLADHQQKVEIKQGIKPEAEPFHLPAAMAAQMRVRSKPQTEQESK